MQGTGTQTDPYIPTAWDEFVTAIETSGAYVKLPEGGGVFDMNEIAPEGGFTVNTDCASILGNNWKILNANDIKFFSTRSKIIDKLHFLKFSLSTNSLLDLSSTTLTQCAFSGTLAKDSCRVGNGLTFRRCSLNLKFFDSALRYTGSSNIYFSRIVLDQSDSLSTASFDTNTSYYNCFIEHKANVNGKEVYLSGNTSVLHSDAGNYILTPSGKKVSVTEEQMKNAAYLRSVGFSIVGK